MKRSSIGSDPSRKRSVIRIKVSRTHITRGVQPFLLPLSCGGHGRSSALDTLIGYLRVAAPTGLHIWPVIVESFQGANASIVCVIGALDPHQSAALIP